MRDRMLRRGVVVPVRVPCVVYFQTREPVVRIALVVRRVDHRLLESAVILVPRGVGDGACSRCE